MTVPRDYLNRRRALTDVQPLDVGYYPSSASTPPPPQGAVSSPAPYGGGYQPVFTQSGFPMSAVNSSEPGKMSEQDRQIIYSMGGQIDSDLQNRIMQQNVEAARAGGRAEELYGRMADRPGYTPEEQEEIRQKEAMDALKYNPETTQGMYATDAEWAGAMGDPSKALQWFDPAHTEDIAGTGARNITGAYETGQGRVMDAVQQGATGQRGAIDAQALTMDPRAAGRIQGAVDSTGRNVRDAIDYEKLKLDATGLKMSDAEREGYVGRAQRQVGNQYRALQDDIELAAAQSGNATPMAIAAAKDRLARRAAVDMADARTNAELAAQAAQRDTYRTAEQMRLGAEQGYSGLRSQAEMGLGNQAINAGLSTEEMRLRAQQGLTGYLTDAERDIANRGVAAAVEQQKLGMDAAQAAANIQQQANQFNQDLGIRAFQTADEQAAARNLALLQNRQGIAQSGDRSQFERTTAIADRGTAAGLNIGNARRGDTQTAAEGFSQARDSANQNINAAQGQRVENYGTMAQGANTATRNKQQYELAKSEMGWGNQVFKPLVGQILGTAATLGMNKMPRGAKKPGE
jgi:hypothetical protein